MINVGLKGQVVYQLNSREKTYQKQSLVLCCVVSPICFRIHKLRLLFCNINVIRRTSFFSDKYEKENELGSE